MGTQIAILKDEQRQALLGLMGGEWVMFCVFYQQDIKISNSSYLLWSLLGDMIPTEMLLIMRMHRSLIQANFLYKLTRIFLQLLQR